MGHKHTREEILQGALEEALEHGISQLTFGRVAKRLGINDRMVVYYFSSKTALVSAVLLALGEKLQTVLAEAFKSPAGDHVELTRAAWPVLARPDIDPIFGMFFEAIGLAASGREPYGTLARQLVGAWIEWLSGFFDGTPSRRRAEAEAAIALLDGLLLLRQLRGPSAANRAAKRLGVR